MNNSVNKSLYALGEHKLTEIFYAKAASYANLFLIFNVDKLFSNSELPTKIHKLGDGKYVYY